MVYSDSASLTRSWHSRRKKRQCVGGGGGGGGGLERTVFLSEMCLSATAVVAAGS